MPPQHNIQKLQQEGRLALSKHAIQNNQLLSLNRAVKLHNVPKSSLRSCLKGSIPIAQSNAKKQNLQLSEEQSLVQWILKLNRRGFPPQIINVRQMADVLLTTYSQNPPPQPVGKNWVLQFINAQPKLQTKWNYKFHLQYAKCEDLKIIGPQFKLIEETRQAYNILNKNTYNFNKTRFIINIAVTSKVVISSNTIGRAITVQLGNCEWVIAIKAVNTTRQYILPFIILAGKLYQAGQY